MLLAINTKGRNLNIKVHLENYFKMDEVERAKEAAGQPPPVVTTIFGKIIDGSIPAETSTWRKKNVWLFMSFPIKPITMLEKAETEDQEVCF